MRFKKITLLTTSFVFLIFVFSNTIVLAANLTNKSDTLNRLIESTLSSHTLSFTLSGSNTLDSGETVTIDFDEDGGGWDVDGASDTISDYTFSDGTGRTIVSVDGDCTGHVGSNDIAVLANDTTGLITFTACSSYTSSASGATIQAALGASAGGTDFITNPTSAAVYEITLNGTQGDTGTLLIPIITNDQVLVDSTVDETVTFSIDDTDIGFGVLTDANSRYATADTTGSNSEVVAHTITAGTNATGGYTITINGNTLESGINSIDAIGGVNTAPSSGSEQFGVRLTASGGSGAVSSPYDGAGYALDTGAFPDEVASTAGSSNNTIYSVYYLANIAASTEAGIYSTSLTYVATGSF